MRRFYELEKVTWSTLSQLRVDNYACSVSGGGFLFGGFQDISVNPKRTDMFHSVSGYARSTQLLTHALHTDRINLSPFTKDFRVWGVLNET